MQSDDEAYVARNGVAEWVKKNSCPADDGGWLGPSHCSGELVQAIMVGKSEDPEIKICLKCGTKWTLKTESSDTTDAIRKAYQSFDDDRLDKAIETVRKVKSGVAKRKKQ